MFTLSELTGMKVNKVCLFYLTFWFNYTFCNKLICDVEQKFLFCWVQAPKDFYNLFF